MFPRICGSALPWRVGDVPHLYVSVDFRVNNKHLLTYYLGSRCYYQVLVVPRVNSQSSDIAASCTVIDTRELRTQNSMGFIV